MLSLDEFRRYAEVSLPAKTAPTEYLKSIYEDQRKQHNPVPDENLDKWWLRSIDRQIDYSTFVSTVDVNGLVDEQGSNAYGKSGGKLMVRPVIWVRIPALAGEDDLKESGLSEQQ